jgi:hypothetical protein
MYLSSLADDLGLCGIQTGNVAGFAAELCEKGILTREEVGFDLKWGDTEAFAKLLEAIAYRKGIGDILAEGVARAADKLSKLKRQDLSRYAVHVKGIGIGAHGARSGKDFRARWWMTKNQYDTPNYRAHCRHILEPTLTLLQELTGKGAQYIVIGIKGSPSCGIYTTTKGEWRGDPSTATTAQTTKASEAGVFMEELFALIKSKGIKEPTKVLEISHEEISQKGLPRETASEL